MKFPELHCAYHSCPNGQIGSSCFETLASEFSCRMSGCVIWLVRDTPTAVKVPVELCTKIYFLPSTQLVIINWQMNTLQLTKAPHVHHTELSEKRTSEKRKSSMLESNVAWKFPYSFLLGGEIFTMESRCKGAPGRDEVKTFFQLHPLLIWKIVYSQALR